MSTPPRLASWLLRTTVRRDYLEAIEGDLAEEFARRYNEHGPAAARRWYRREAVAAAVLVRRCRRSPAAAPRGDSAMRHLVQDIRFGGRSLLTSPGYALAITLMVALAIGANSVIFSFAKPFLFNPLPIVEPETLAFLYSIDPQQTMRRGKSSYADFSDWRDRLRSFRSLAAWTDTNVTLTGLGDAERLQARLVTPNLFATWGLKPTAGRLLAEGDDRPGTPCLVVLSDHLWTSRFQRDPSVASRSILVDGRACTVTGVMPPSIEIGNLSLVDVWMPLADVATSRRDDRRLGITGRLAPGVTVEAAATEVAAATERLQREHPDTNRGWTARTLSTREAMAGADTFIVLGMLVLVVVLILVIACANVANLMLARVAGRRRELAIRTALGATRWTIVRELVLESGWLGLAGGALGVALAAGALRVVRAVSAEAFFKIVDIDRGVLLFAFALSFLAPLLFSVLPALHSSEATSDGLKEGGRSGSTRRAGRSRAALVVAQVSLALMLLVVAGLVLRTLVEMNRVEYGFDAKKITTAELELPKWKNASPASAARFHGELLARLRRSPDVAAAAVTTALPVLSNGRRVQLDLNGAPAGPDERAWAYEFRTSDGYFETLGLPILGGRVFTDSDAAGREEVAIVDAEAVRRYWRSPEAAIGGRLSTTPPGAPARWRRVVGVVGNVANADIEAALVPHIYLPIAQEPASSAAVVIRAASAEPAIAALRAAVASVDRDVPLFQVRTLQDRIDEELSSSRILTTLFVVFAAVALALAASGVYAVISYAVGQRTQEIGVRMALGAQRGDIQRLVFGQGLRMVGMGSAIGLAGAALLGRALSSVLFRVTPFDPLTYTTVIAIVLASSGVSILIPAWRATRLDPIRSLRAE